MSIEPSACVALATASSSALGIVTPPACRADGAPAAARRAPPAWSARAGGGAATQSAPPAHDLRRPAGHTGAVVGHPRASVGTSTVHAARRRRSGNLASRTPSARRAGSLVAVLYWATNGVFRAGSAHPWRAVTSLCSFPAPDPA